MRRKQNLKIFCVDDNTVYLQILENEIKKSDHHHSDVHCFYNAEECLKNLDVKPDIIILDYFLDTKTKSSFNGIDVLKKIKKINSNISVVMLSAQDNIDVAVSSMKFGAFDYVVKNESGFIRTQNAINNIANGIRLKKEAKAYKRGSFAAISFILTLVLSIVLLCYLFPSVFKIGSIF